METRPKILAALRPQGVVAVQRAVSQYLEPLAARSYEHAVSLLRSRDDIDLVVCGVFFDETRMFDLLRTVRQQFPDIPFVCCRIGERELAPVTLEAIGIAAQSMGAAGLINLSLIQANDTSDQEFRSFVLRYLRRRP
jgi:CheY-like chemotaxis protein